MNRKQLKRALMHFSTGKRISEISELIDFPKTTLQAYFKELNVETSADARKAFQKLEDEESSMTGKTPSYSNEIIPEWSNQAGHTYQFNFDKAKAIINDNKNIKEKIPLARQQEFRRDLRDLEWEDIVVRWHAKLDLDEATIKEQAILLAPQTTQTRFGFRKE